MSTLFILNVSRLMDSLFSHGQAWPSVRSFELCFIANLSRSFSLPATAGRNAMGIIPGIIPRTEYNETICSVTLEM